MLFYCAPSLSQQHEDFHFFCQWAQGSINLPWRTPSDVTSCFLPSNFSLRFVDVSVHKKIMWTETVCNAIIWFEARIFKPAWWNRCHNSHYWFRVIVCLRDSFSFHHMVAAKSASCIINASVCQMNHLTWTDADSLNQCLMGGKKKICCLRQHRMEKEFENHHFR